MRPVPITPNLVTSFFLREKFRAVLVLVLVLVFVFVRVLALLLTPVPVPRT